MNNLGRSKKPRVCNFQDEWEEKYSFIQLTGNGVCLLCHISAMPEKHNTERPLQKIKVDLAKIVCLTVNSVKLKLVT
jgi:hypothetical protein